MGGVVSRHILAVRVDGDEVCVLARQVTDDSVRVEYIHHVLHTSFISIKRIELEGRRLRVFERRLEYTVLEREVYVTNHVYVDKILNDEEAKYIYDDLVNFLQYPGDFAYLYSRLTSQKTE
jgi:hypothetical protein